MLKFRLASGEAHTWWRWDKRWQSGSSFVTPYPHPSLEHAVITDGQSTFIVVRERKPSGGLGNAAGRFVILESKRYEDLLTEAREWPLDFVLIRKDSQGAYQITTGQWGTAPIYIADREGMLYGSWSLHDLRPYLRTESLDEVVVARLLTQRSRYTRDTLFQNIYRLTERAEGHYTRDGLTLHYPQPALRARPRPVKAGVDIISAYEKCLEQAVTERAHTPDESAVELSGGIDSANVAMSLAHRDHGRLLAYALLIGGEAGDQQVSRRREMLAYTRFRDVTVPALDFAPLHPSGGRAHGDFVEPSAEPYHEAVAHMLNTARAAGVRTVFTGDGGDELVGLRSEEWATLGKVLGRHAPNRELPSWLAARALDAVGAIDENLAPPTVINEATLLGFACRSPQFLAAGLWPVSPMCSPRLIRFAEQLPLEWRADKKISRERLTRLGFGEHIAHPPLRENFRYVMVHGLRTYGMTWLSRFLDGSILVDLGFVDGDELRQAHTRMMSGGSVENLIFQFLVLELALRAVERTDTNRSELCT